MEWKNRIIGHGSKPASQFQAHPNNWRKHPARQRKAVKGSLDDLGWIDTVIENVRTGRLIDGHERVWQALDNGDAEVPYIQVDLSEAEEAQALLSLDAIAALAESDAEKIDALLQDVKTDNADVMEFLADMANDNGLYEEAQKDAEPQIDKAAELNKKWQVQTGDLWQIGEHRLLCGDSTKAEDVARVMAGEKAAVVSDPPYGVAVVGKNGTVGGGNICAVGVYSPIVGDETTYTAKVFYLLCREIGFSAFGFWGGNYFTDFLPPSSCWFVWDKRWDIASNNFADCELMWTNLDKPARVFKQVWMGMIKEGEHGKRVHPTQKPVDAVQESIKLFTEDAIFDGFLGSGTTMVACQNLNRKCRAIEISPDYCAVILERMQNTFPELEIKKLQTVNT